MPRCVTVHNQAESSKHAKHCIKIYKCVCVYGFNVWSHDKARTEATVCMCLAIILSIAMETCFYLICIWVYQPQRERERERERERAVSFSPRKHHCPPQRLEKFHTRFSRVNTFPEHSENTAIIQKLIKISY